ncbi:MAG TPA: hypothetical protein VGK08_04335, partial [Thermoanaerobaculia bacterium]
FARTLDRLAGPSATLLPEDFFEEREAAPTSLRRLSTSLSRLQSTVESADASPTPDALTGFRHRREAVEEGLARWVEFLRSDLPRANGLLESAGLPTIRLE